MSIRSLFILLCLFSFSQMKAQDYWPPDTPLLDTVSVYNDSLAIVSWFPCDSTDVVGYIVYRNVNTVWVTADTVLAPVTSYIDFNAQSNYHTEQYRIAAYDEAGNLSLMTPLDGYHNTIYVFPYQEYENCQPMVRLHWTKYQLWPEGISEYQIWTSLNYAPYTLLTTIYSGDNEYKHFSINDTTSYCYYIKAVSNSGKTSTSNKTCIYIDYANIPAYVNIDYVTVNSFGSLDISCSLDNNAQVRNIRLERANSGSGNYSTIATVNNFTQSSWFYTENPGITTEWKYRVLAIDACGNTLLESNEATNIVVYGYGDRELNHFLTWNNYRYFTGDVDRYDLYRSVDDAPSELIATLTDTSYTDNVAAFANSMSYGKFSYYVIARESNVFPGKGCSSISSTKDLYQFSRVFIPNTFSPNSDTLNPVFKPIVSFILKDGYYFAIYSRWGNKLFETTDSKKGWDGKHKGKPMKQDTYVFVLRYATQAGVVKEESGYVYIYYPLAN